MSNLCIGIFRCVCIGLFGCVLVVLFCPTQQFFSHTEKVTITGEGLQNLTYSRHSCEFFSVRHLLFNPTFCMFAECSNRLRPSRVSKIQASKFVYCNRNGMGGGLYERELISCFPATYWNWK